MEHIMNSCFATSAALFLLFAAACSAPAGLSLQDACADVRSSSQELNRIAKDLSIEARNGSKDVTNLSTSLLWVEAKDMCDPETLKQKPATCIGKILDALTSYNFAMERVAGFQSCSEFVSKVKPVMHRLHKDMSKCVKSKIELDHHESHVSNAETQPILRWQEALLCHYTLDRLVSFSILTARVFAVGDPAHHTEASAQKCM